MRNLAPFLLLALSLLGCGNPDSIHTFPFSEDDYEKVLAWHFARPAASSGLIVKGGVHPDLNLVIREQFVSSTPERGSCGNFSLGAGRRLGVRRAIDFVAESEAFEIPIIFDYVSPEDPLTTECGWESIGVYFYIRDRASGKFLDSMTLVPYASMQNFYNSKPLPGKIDFYCSSSAVKNPDDGFALEACETSMSDQNVQYFGVPNNLITEFNQSSDGDITGKPFFDIAITQVP